MPWNFVDLTGQRFGRLRVIRRNEEVNNGKQKRVYWDCICDCGRGAIVSSGNLKNGHTQSCGCLHPKFSSEDLTGKQFGKLRVIKRSERVSSGKRNRIYWDCICDCGNQVTVQGDHLRSGHTQSCGCSKQEFTGEELTGKKYGRLTVKQFIGKKGNHYLWKCQCECGNISIVHASALKTGNTKSCGCLKKEQNGKASITHGKRRTPLYTVWINMKRRCNNKNDKSYRFYGEKGVRVCNLWEKDFGAFYDWSMKNGYEKGLQLDRIDTCGNYSPENCRFISQKENENNRRDNIHVEVSGKDMTLSQYAEIKKLNYDRLRYLYVDCGLSLETIEENDYMNKPYKRQSLILYEYKGESHTLRELSQIYNVDYVTLCSRVRSLKWDIARAIEEPKNIKFINERYKKK